MRNFVTDFGGVGDGATDNSGAWAAFMASGDGALWVPSGTYRFDAPISLNGVRNRRIVGDGGNGVQPKTVFAYHGADPAAFVNIKSCVNISWADICFRSNVAVEYVILTHANPAPDVSCIHVSFDRCTAMAPGVTVYGLLRPINTVFFRWSDGWLYHANTAVFAGANASDSSGTLAGGSVNHMVIERTHLTGDTILRRSHHATFRNNLFDMRADGKTSIINTNSGDAANNNVTLDGNFCGYTDPGAGNYRPFFTQGANSKGLRVTGNSLRYFSAGFDMAGLGYGAIEDNWFIGCQYQVNLRGLTNVSVARNFV